MLMKKAVIIGAGPAGLTAALELLRKTNIQPVILEASEEIGGISRTIRYKGNRMDIGGHRFFSKSDRVMQWWMELMPVESGEGGAEISYQGKQRTVAIPVAVEEEPPLRGMGPLKHEAQDDGVGAEEMAEHSPTVTVVAAAAPESDDLVMLARRRKSRIYILRKI